ncbi:hypothetical protein GPICK_07565 [Geobacter pickeringii]|uniref:Cohesin domain-containing protein n=2 Tax=Geobacter pickeringii TaxID=345632 RepID=A0A0B5B9I5_9BACT|nr:hypothetical protein GPICK_07565 [Geobacter pickeringii]
MARMEIVIRYDPSTLAHPRVDRAGGIPRLVQSSDTSDSGVVTIKASRNPAFTGSGTVASLHFDRTGPSPGTVDSMDGVIYNDQGVPMSAQVSITNPPPDQSGTGREGDPATAGRGGGGPPRPRFRGRQRSRQPPMKALLRGLK